DQEMEIVQRLFRLADVGFPLTPKQLRKCVYSYCEEKEIETPFDSTNAIAGKKMAQMLFETTHTGS
ncbi:hypothetical protein U1Q18_051345, partial [Sarracenia purpurea var. burkii]